MALRGVYYFTGSLDDPELTIVLLLWSTPVLCQVHYATALDWFIICSFLYCLASILEFAGVHYFTKVGCLCSVELESKVMRRYTKISESLTRPY